MRRWIYPVCAMALAVTISCRDMPVVTEVDTDPETLTALENADALTLDATGSIGSVGGAAFTTFNASVDGAGKDVCKNTAINCNIYGAKEYVWLNGGPTANHLKPDGDYFFAVLVPGGQPNPNDGGAKNLSDDYDAYTNRIFTVTNGEVSAYAGTHWLDNGVPGGPKPNGLPPYIRLFPYADTWNPGGVYILAICSLEAGYPVNPRNCKYDAFKVQKKLEMSFFLEGMKFEDVYADAINDGDPGLPGWQITIVGTGLLGEAINATVTTGADGTWSFEQSYTYTSKTTPVNANLTICEVLKPGWTQSYPTPSCYTLEIPPAGVAYVGGLDFGNWRPVSVTACKRRPDAEGAYTVPVPGWEVSLTAAGEVVDTQLTGADGCYTWTGLTPGVAYDVHEAVVPGWKANGPVDYVFPTGASGAVFQYIFENTPTQGCTPGFWQGGSDFGHAGGKWLWNDSNDPEWVASGGIGFNPYVWGTLFNGFFMPYPGLDGFDMMALVSTGGGADDFQKAARSLVAAYLNASWGMAYEYTTAELVGLWNAAVATGNFLDLHTMLDLANNAGYRSEELLPRCPISASLN